MRLNLYHVAAAVGAWLVVQATTYRDGAASCVPDAPAVGASTADSQDSEQMARRIDALMEQAWDADHVTAAPAASDGEFLRRAYLDLNGVIPRVGEVRVFLDDERPGKRVELVDRLLTSP